MPRTACTSSAIVSPSSGPRQPSRNPTNSSPWTWTPLRTTARMTAFRPGQSPPPVRTPMRTSVSVPRTRRLGRIGDSTGPESAAAVGQGVATTPRPGSASLDDVERVAFRVAEREHRRDSGPPQYLRVHVDATIAQVRMVGLGVPGREADAGVGPDGLTGRPRSERYRGHRPRWGDFDPTLTRAERDVQALFESQLVYVEPDCSILIGHRYSHRPDLGDPGCGLLAHSIPCSLA